MIELSPCRPTQASACRRRRRAPNAPSSCAAQPLADSRSAPRQGERGGGNVHPRLRRPRRQGPPQLPHRRRAAVPRPVRLPPRKGDEAVGVALPRRRGPGEHPAAAALVPVSERRGREPPGPRAARHQAVDERNPMTHAHMKRGARKKLEDACAEIASPDGHEPTPDKALKI